MSQMEVNVEDALNTLPFSVWDEIASNLETQSGMATVDLPLLIQELHAHSFSVARQALDAVKKTTTSIGGKDDDSSDKVPDATTLTTDHDETATAASSVVKVIAPGEDSAHVTGFHWAGGSNSMSRYNAHREGFVFSDGQRLPVSTIPEFESSMEHLFESLHGIANHVLLALERKWDLPPNYFQQSMGPTCNSSQWHVKRYVQENDDGREKEEVEGLTSEISSKNDGEEAKILLPSHTDPSLVSVVIHDQVGRIPGAMGLQYYRTVASSVEEELTICPSGSARNDEMDKDDKNKRLQRNHHPKRVWTEVPFHGHAVATIFVGSVLSHITGGRLSSVKHRVVQSTSTNGAVQDGGGRMAATLFVRPQGTALLQLPPTPRLEGVFLKTNMTFDVWNARVSKNYMKKPNPQKQQANGTTNVASSISNSQKSDVSKGPKAEHKDSNDDRDGYYCDDITEMSLITGTPPLKGRDKYLGGEVGSNGKIYTIPGHATRVLVMDPFVDPITVIPIGPELHGEYKWLRGVLAPATGIIYGIPCHADAILRIDTSTNHVSTITWNVNDPKAPAVGLPWKWHGGNISKYDGCLYCVPQFAEYVMKINTITEEVSFMGDCFPGTNKWYGGLVGKADGAIYGICQNATGVLRIDPERQMTTIHGAYPSGGYKWHGGVAGADGNIYGIPAHSDTVLKIEPGLEPRITTIGGPLRTGQHRNDGKYKFLGGAVGHDGNVYFFPSDSDFVLQVQPTGTVREVGPNLREMETIQNNKWQNGFTLADGTIFGIPLKGASVLRIQTFADGREPEVSTIGGPYKGLNKWEGGVLGKDGRMFCMPLNHQKVLQIKPRKDPSL